MIAPPIVLAPLLSWPWFGLLAALAGLAVLPALLRRAPGGLTRALAFLFLLAILIGPRWIKQTRHPLPDIAILLVDRSQSMTLGDRTALASRAAAALRATAGTVQLRIIEIPPASSGGTALFAALTKSLAALPPAQLAGIIAITDGEIADPPAAMAAIPPFTALLTARHEETDRELRLIDSPGYGLAGQTVKLRLQVLDHGSANSGATAPITVTEDGVALTHQTVTIGAQVAVDLPVHHVGPNIVQISVAALPGEVSTINNQAVFTVNGIQKRLNVLLISGSPDLGERSWRLLLKSDPATQLVHFTILRTPGETVDADPADLALVPFPVHQLFETDIGKFDLIILDRFNTAGLLPVRYTANIATYVENGGALLADLGPEFFLPNSLAYSPLGPVLLAQPADAGTLSQIFSPAVTALGARHPVTAPFAGQALAPWMRMEVATATSGDVLMNGPNNAPLLILGQAGKGRVGMLLSDQFWLWTRGNAHAGPALPLLRRIVHWLLRDPALESESLSARFVNGALTIDRQTVSITNPGAITVTAPGGGTSQLSPRQIGPGHFSASIAIPPSGVWKFSEGNLTAYAADPIANAAEYQDLAATAGVVRPLAGRTVWLGQTATPPLPDLIRPRHASVADSTRDIPLLPPLPAMLIALTLLCAAWWRESR